MKCELETAKVAKMYPNPGANFSYLQVLRYALRNANLTAVKTIEKTSKDGKKISARHSNSRNCCCSSFIDVVGRFALLSTINDTKI